LKVFIIAGYGWGLKNVVKGEKYVDGGVESEIEFL